MLRRFAIPALLLVLAIGLAACGDDDATDSRTTTRDDTTETADENGADVPEAEEEVEVTEPPEDVAPLRVTTRDTESMGTPATYVTTIAGVPVGEGAGLSGARSTLGEPAESGPDEDAADHCHATWPDLGLELLFYFGHPPSAQRSCREGIVAAAVMEGPRWVTQPGGLSVGDDESRITETHPGAKRADVPKLLQRDLPDDVTAWVLEHGAYGGQPYPTLYAVVQDETVIALLYVSGAD